MSIRHWETSNFEVYEGDSVPVIKFNCPQCLDSLAFEGDDPELSAPFEVTCHNCQSTIFCQLKIVMDWD